MRSVSIIGVGMSKFGERWEASLRDLVVEAGSMAINDSGCESKDIDAIFGGCMAPGRFVGQEHLGAVIADELGLNPIPATRCEAACASGALALSQGYLSIAAGKHDVVAVGGVEKMTDVSTEEAATTLGGAGDEEFELFNGATFPALYAMLAQMHMKEFGTTEEQMAACSVKSHLNGSKNKYAQYQSPITIDTVMNSGYIATPLKLFDCSPITDVAAAVILCATEKAKQYTKKPLVEILASEQASDSLALAGRKTLTELRATKEAAAKAFKYAKLTPKDIQVAEVHDCFSIAEIMAIEDLGFFTKGKGGKATEDGETALNSRI